MTLASRLIGRAPEWARLDQLAAGGGLVTLTGPGGVGKSRLAIEFAEDRRARTGGAVTVGLLAAVPRGAGGDLVADALGFESVDAASVVLVERGGVVVLDNCEHVLDAARDVASAIRGCADDVFVIATSREPLGADGEHVMVLDPLGLPAPGGADADRSPAVELFLDRAGAAGALLDPGPALLADVAELCRRLDGLPLAIELAAARTRAIAPGDLLAVVDRRLDLLRRTRQAGDRHDSMRAALDVSTSLLTAAERTFFRRLGVFRGPFDLRLAAAVAGDPASDRSAALDMLAGLVDRSLVTTERRGSETRYRLLDLLREHAVDHLVEADELPAVQERFVEAMVGVADDIVVQALRRWDPAMLGAASSQFANLVRAVELCLDRDAGPERSYRLLLPMFAAVHEGRPDEVWLLGARVRRRWDDGVAPWRAEVFAVLATAAAVAGRHDDVGPLASAVIDDPTSSDIALALADRAWGLASRAADPIAAARHFELAGAAALRAGYASMNLEVRAFEAGELDVAGDGQLALDVLDDVVRRSTEADDTFVLVLAHLVRSRVLLRAGAVDDAAADLAAAEEASAALGQRWWTAATLRTAAALASFGPGGWASSTTRWLQAVDVAASQGALGEVAITLRTAASVARHLGEHEQAAVLFATAPRSSAITVLPELFPEARAELEATTPVRPRGLHVVDVLQRARAALGAAPGPGPAAGALAGGPPDRVSAERVSAELVVEGDSWRVVFAGRTVRARDMKGIRDLAVLVARPGVEVHALELMGARDVGGAAGPVIDDRARRDYRSRVIELQRDIDEAHADNDRGRAEQAEVELDALVEQLSEAFGLGGRARTTGSSAERARTAVTYRVRSAIRRLDELHPDLGRHLTNAVRTGTWCSYRPEQDVVWTVERGGLTL